MGRVSNARQKLLSAVLELIWTGSYGRTTVDEICERAGVKKGSFYHFFDSKADLAVAAVESSWEKQKEILDSVFSPVVPPLDRIRDYCAKGYQKQVELKEECGSVLGCPLFTLGAEVCHCERRLREQVQLILAQYHKYLESAIRDAHSGGWIEAPRADATARILFAYFEGLLTQARILNDTEVLKEMEEGAWAILGVKRGVGKKAA